MHHFFKILSLQGQNFEWEVNIYFFHAKNLKKKLDHFLVQKDCKKSWVTFECIF